MDAPKNGLWKMDKSIWVIQMGKWIGKFSNNKRKHIPSVTDFDPCDPVTSIWVQQVELIKLIWRLPVDVLY